MPDKLAEYVRESLERRYKNVRAEELVRILPPETLRELIRLVKANGQTDEQKAAEDRPRE